MAVVIYIMGLFLWKYYDVFSKRDKVIIEYLKVLLLTGVLVYFIYDYPSSNSFFLFMYPFFILINIYKLIKFQQQKDNVVVYSSRDNLVINSLQSLAFIGMAIGIYITSKGDMLFITAIPLIYVAYTVNKMVKLYRSQTKV